MLYGIMPKLKRPKRSTNGQPTQVFIRFHPTVGGALQSLADSDKRKLASYCRIVLEEHAEKARKTA